MSLKLNERYPGRFNNPSGDYPGGSFKNRTAPGAKDGSYLEQDWANDKEGFLQSIIAAVGETPNGLVDKVGASQFFDCLLRLAQNQVAQAFPTAGTATALTLTPIPAISAYTASQRFSVKFHVSSGANPTINASAKGAKSLKQYDASGAKVSATFVVGQISDVVYDGVDFVLMDQLPTAASNLVGVVGSAKNLRVSANGAGAVVTVSADELVVESAANSYATLRSIAIAPSFTVAGANGLDVGAANSQTASTWYSVWVIWSGSTIAGLLSLSETTPTLPGGYTHKARVGWVRTDATGNKYPLAFTQVGRRAQYAALRDMATGVLSQWSAIAVGAFVPPTARVIIGRIQNLNALCAIAPNTTYDTYGISQVYLPSGSGSAAQQFNMLMESSNIYGYSTASGSKISALGWEDVL